MAIDKGCTNIIYRSEADKFNEPWSHSVKYTDSYKCNNETEEGSDWCLECLNMTEQEKFRQSNLKHESRKATIEAKNKEANMNLLGYVIFGLVFLIGFIRCMTTGE